MEISPATFREVEFREKRHGYHPEDVDQFLERMAVATETLQERMRQTLQRAEQAEQDASEAGRNDDALRRTLVLGQRTADQAVKEARDQATRILSTAEQRARALVTDAEDRARQLHADSVADVHAELLRLEGMRAHAQQEVDVLSRWSEESRANLTAALQSMIGVIDSAGVGSPPPPSTPLDLPIGTADPGPAAPSAGAEHEDSDRNRPTTSSADATRPSGASAARSSAPQTDGEDQSPRARSEVDVRSVQADDVATADGIRDAGGDSARVGSHAQRRH